MNYSALHFNGLFQCQAVKYDMPISMSEDTQFHVSILAQTFLFVNKWI